MQNTDFNKYIGQTKIFPIFNIFIVFQIYTSSDTVKLLYKNTNEQVINYILFGSFLAIMTLVCAELFYSDKKFEKAQPKLYQPLRTGTNILYLLNQIFCFGFSRITFGYFRLIQKQNIDELKISQNFKLIKVQENEELERILEELITKSSTGGVKFNEEEKLLILNNAKNYKTLLIEFNNLKLIKVNELKEKLFIEQQNLLAKQAFENQLIEVQRQAELAKIQASIDALKPQSNFFSDHWIGITIGCVALIAGGFIYYYYFVQDASNAMNSISKVQDSTIELVDSNNTLIKKVNENLTEKITTIQDNVAIDLANIEAKQQEIAKESASLFKILNNNIETQDFKINEAVKLCQELKIQLMENVKVLNILTEIIGGSGIYDAFLLNKSEYIILKNFIYGVPPSEFMPLERCKDLSMEKLKEAVHTLVVKDLKPLEVKQELLLKLKEKLEKKE